MTAAVNHLQYQGQKLVRREEQYEFIKNMPDDSVILDRTLVRHRNTGEKFLLKVIANDAPQAIREQSLQELKSLQKSNQMQETIELVDCFVNAQNDVYMVTKIPKSTLAEYVKQ